MCGVTLVSCTERISASPALSRGIISCFLTTHAGVVVEPPKKTPPISRSFALAPIPSPHSASRVRPRRKSSSERAGDGLGGPRPGPRSAARPWMRAAAPHRARAPHMDDEDEAAEIGHCARGAEDEGERGAPTFGVPRRSRVSQETRSWMPS